MGMLMIISMTIVLIIVNLFSRYYCSYAFFASLSTTACVAHILNCYRFNSQFSSSYNLKIKRAALVARSYEVFNCKFVSALNAACCTLRLIN